jgi:hypothetical protein
MMSTHSKRGFPLVVLAIVAGLTGCDRLLEVQLPGSVPSDKLDDPTLAQVLVSSVAADFECAYNNYTFGASSQSDEMWSASGNVTMRNWGQQKIYADFDNYVNGSCGGGGYGLWRTLHAARFQAESNFERISGFADADVDGKNGKLATVAAYGGYTYTFFGETFCQVAFDGGSAVDPSESLAIAEERFGAAIDLAQQAGNADILNLARVGRARVRLDLGRYADASADAAAVPAGFVFWVTRGDEDPSRQNKGKTLWDEGGHATVTPGFRGLEWKGVEDPRTIVRDVGRVGLDGVTELFLSDKYPARNSPIRLASWEEAQLIVAEAAARSGNNATAVAIINAMHTANGLPAYDPATDGAVMDHLIQERSRELFQEGGHRMADMLRFGLPFFTGVDHLGEQWGTTTCFPLPRVEGGD